jgi:hypothetical protein
MNSLRNCLSLKQAARQVIQLYDLAVAAIDPRRSRRRSQRARRS